MFSLECHQELPAILGRHHHIQQQNGGQLFIDALPRFDAPAGSRDLPLGCG
jgi:hypothetical protein